MTTVEQFITQAHYETPRNGRGQYLMADTSGTVGPRTRATTFADTLANPFSLHQWKMRVACKGMSLRPDLVAVAASTPLEDKKTFAGVVESAFDRGGGNDAARQGTALHQFVTALATGTLTEDAVPAELTHDVHAYFRELARLGITEDTTYMERAVYNETYDVGGTFDRIYTLPDGSQVIGDIKTGSDLSFGEHEFAVQLALYANADIMFQPGSAEVAEPMPHVRKDFALIVHVPHGRGEAYVERLDISLGWWAARLCAEARMWRATHNIRTPYIPGLGLNQKKHARPGGEPWIRSMITPTADAIAQHTADKTFTVTADTEVFRNALATANAVLEQTRTNGSLQSFRDEAPEVSGTGASFTSVTPPDSIKKLTRPLEVPDELVGGASVPFEPVAPPSEPLIDPDVEAEELFTQLKKSKPKTQDLARRVMASMPDGPSIKLNTYAINVCNAIVRHPMWPRFRENIDWKSIDWTIPNAPKPNTDPTPAKKPTPSLDRRSIVSPQTQQTLDDFDAIQAAANPFTAAPVFDEAYYLREIEQCANKKGLAILWQHAQDHGAIWTDKLNTAGIQHLFDLGTT